jgi:indole-3-acetate monooxygenase
VRRLKRSGLWTGSSISSTRPRTEIECNRRLPDSVVAALRHTGINRLLIPTVLGGMEAPITDVMDIMERIAAVDGSAGWCAAIGAGSNLFAGYMPATGAGTVFADPDQGHATMFAPVGRVVSDHGRAALSAGHLRATASTVQGSASVHSSMRPME